MNIEQDVITNLRLLPTERQQDVLVFIHSLLPLETQGEVKTAIRHQIIPVLRQIQNFHDGLPSAGYASKLLRSTQTLASQFSDTALGPLLRSLHQSLSPNQRWSYYTLEYYQTVTQLLSELVDRPTLTPSDIQSAIHAIEQISQTMTHSGIVTDQELEDYVEA
jgi:hypothetical protein